jgi:hypothetical protein
LYHKERNNEKLTYFFSLCFYVIIFLPLLIFEQGYFLRLIKKAFAFQSIEAKGGIKQVFESI